VEPDDQMFKTLLALREDIYSHLNAGDFINAMEKHFRLVRRLEIPKTRRELMHFSR
jgi:hypothetical protein